MWTTLVPEALENLKPDEVLSAVLNAQPGQTACLTCSFQAEDMIVLDLVRKRIPSIPVLFLETGYHFAHTYEYRDRMAKEWSLNLVNVIPRKTVEQQESELGILYRTDPTRCCQLRKVQPLFQALAHHRLCVRANMLLGDIGDSDRRRSDPGTRVRTSPDRRQVPRRLLPPRRPGGPGRGPVRVRGPGRIDHPG